MKSFQACLRILNSISHFHFHFKKLQFQGHEVHVSDGGAVAAIHGSLFTFAIDDFDAEGSPIGYHIGLWDFNSDLFETFGWNYAEIQSLRITPDGRHLLASDHEAIRIFGLEPGRRTAQHSTAQASFFEKNALGTSYWLDNSRLVSVKKQNRHISKLAMWDLESMSCEPLEIATTNGVFDCPLILAANGNIIATGEGGMEANLLNSSNPFLTRIKLWDIRAGATVRTLDVPQREHQKDESWALWQACCFDSDNRTAVVHSDGSLFAFDLGSGQLSFSMDGYYSTIRRSFALNPTGTVCVGRGGAEADDGEGVVVWDLVRRQCKPVLANPYRDGLLHFGMAASPDLESVGILTRDHEGDVRAHVWSV